MTVTSFVQAPAASKAGSERPAAGGRTQRLPKTFCGVLGPVGRAE